MVAGFRKARDKTSRKTRSPLSRTAVSSTPEAALSAASGRVDGARDAMEPPADLVAAMQARGKWTNRHAARKLTAASIRAYGESRTRGVVALFDQADPPPHSPPAWLTTALREGWRPGCKPKPDDAPAPEQRACEACGSVYRPAPDQDDATRRRAPAFTSHDRDRSHCP